jgi:hypothetical protein
MFDMIDSKTKHIIISQCLEREKIKPFLERYSRKVPNLDDVRFGLARVNTRGFVKWIPWKKLTKKQRKLFDNSLLKVMAFPLMRRMNYSEIASKMLIVEPMTQGVGGYYDK